MIMLILGIVFLIVAAVFLVPVFVKGNGIYILGTLIFGVLGLFLLLFGVNEIQPPQHNIICYDVVYEDVNVNLINQTYSFESNGNNYSFPIDACVLQSIDS